MRILLFIFLITIAGCATIDKPYDKDGAGLPPKPEYDVRYEGQGINLAHCPPVTQLVKDKDGTVELK